jgi:hypothetical protein
MRAWALIEIGDTEAVDVFVREEGARCALEECLRDEPDWSGLLRVVEMELAEVSDPSRNVN